MSEPLSNLVVDPEGTYAVAYQGTAAGSQSFATNPNEIVIFDLTPGHTRQVARTLRSFGGTPQRLTFSPELNLPAQAAQSHVTATPRRLLVVETNIDVTIVDLSHAFDQPAPTPDITLRLTEGTSTTPVTPAGLAIDPNPDDGFIALRTTASNNVFTFQLVAAPPPAARSTPANDFTANPNLTDVGGVASDIQFVNTSDGLRVAALIPSTSRAVLFEPVSSAKTLVDLPSPYSKLSLVTQAVTATSAGSTGKPPDVAMLWTAIQNAGPAAGVALWTLDTAVQGAPYRSIEVLSVEDPIASVIDVPDSPNGALKILTTPSSSTHAFYVLDLVRRTPSPLDTMGTPSLSLSPDGLRVWAFVGGGTDLASITLDTLNPTPLTTDAPISAVFDIAAQGYDARMGTGPRTLVAIHAQGTLGATLFDAKTPKTANARRSVGLLLEGP